MSNFDDITKLIQSKSDLIYSGKGKVRRGVTNLFLIAIDQDINELLAKNIDPYLIYTILQERNLIPDFIKKETFIKWLFKNKGSKKIKANKVKQADIKNTVASALSSSTTGVSTGNNIYSNPVSVSTPVPAPVISSAKANSVRNNDPVTPSSVIQNHVSSTKDLQAHFQDQQFNNRDDESNAENNIQVIQSDYDFINFQIERITNENKANIDSSENIWLQAIERVIKITPQEIQQESIHSNEEVPVKEETLNRKFGIVPKHLYVLDPSRADYPFVVKVNWLLHDENGIIYIKSTQLPIPASCTIFPRNFSDKQNIVSRNIRLTGDPNGEYNKDKIINELTEQYNSTGNIPQVIKLLKL